MTHIHTLLFLTIYFPAISSVNLTQLDTIELTGHTSSCTKYICLWGSKSGHSLHMQLCFAQYKLDPAWNQTQSGNLERSEGVTTNGAHKRFAFESDQGRETWQRLPRERFPL